MTLDERIRAALARRAGDARLAPDLYARILDRRRRRRRALVAVPLTATAAVVAFAVAVAANVPAERRPPAAEVTAAPAPLAAALTQDGPFRVDGDSGALVGRFGPSRDATAVASGHDGTTYAFAEGPGGPAGGCKGTIVRVAYVDDGVVERQRFATHGWVEEMAYSPDGTRLAYVTHAARGAECERTELHVRDLATGRERVWTDGLDGFVHVMGTGAWLTGLSWSPDGTALAYKTGMCCVTGGEGFTVLDLTREASVFNAGRPRGGSVPDPDDTGRYCTLGAAAYRGRDGAMTAVRTCSDPTGAAGTGRTDLVVVDPDLGTVGELLAAVPLDDSEQVTTVAWDPAGDRALLFVTGGGKPTQRLLAWHAGGGVRTVLSGDLRQVSW
jgi:Tol biopolymer transport system component